MSGLRPLLRALPRLARPALTTTRPFHRTVAAPKKQATPRMTNPQNRFAQDNENPHVVSDKTYHYLADRTLDTFYDNVELAAEEREELDIEHSSGIVTLKTPQGTYVLNKQPPNRQIWLSSPISGPKRFDYDVETRKWVYRRDGTDLEELLMEEVGVAPDPIDIPKY